MIHLLGHEVLGAVEFLGLLLESLEVLSPVLHLGLGGLDFILKNNKINKNLPKLIFSKNTCIFDKS